MPTPLGGVRVLDFSHAYAGPFCSMLLADLGADVVKLEPPGGDHLRTAAALTEGGLSLHFAMHNRSKRSIRLNLRDERGRALLYRLIPHFDVLVENYRPGVMQRLGCAYEDLRGHRPDLIMLSLSGFGQEGPYAQRAADDKVVQAMSGFMDLTGEPDGPPAKVGGSPSDYIAALYGALAIVSGLMLRARTGQGQYIDLSLLDGVITTLAVPLAQYQANGELIRRTGNVFPGAAADGLFPTSDGWVYLSTGQDRQWAKLCEAMGRENLADRDGYRTRAERFAKIDEINAIIADWTGARTTAQAVEALTAVGVSCGEVNTLAQMVADPQVRSRELLFSLASAAWGPVPGVRLPFLSDQLGTAEPSPPPRLAEHADEIFGSLAGLSPSEIQALRNDYVI